MTRIAFTILGQPQSKANSRQFVLLGERMASIKSKTALAYERAALMQIPVHARVRLVGPVRMWIRIFYASERPDLDESIVLDVLQDRFAGKGDKKVLAQAGVYRNDRQVRERHVWHEIDRTNPRTEVVIEPMQEQQSQLALQVDEPLPF